MRDFLRDGVGPQLLPADHVDHARLVAAIRPLATRAPRVARSRSIVGLLTSN